MRRVRSPASEAGPSDGNAADADPDPAVAGGPDDITGTGPVNGRDTHPEGLTMIGKLLGHNKVETTALRAPSERPAQGRRQPDRKPDC